MYMTNHPSVIISRKYSFIIIWNVDGELHNPKSMMVGSYRPQFVIKAAFHSSPSFIRTLLYPHQRSNFEKYFTFRNFNNRSDTKGVTFVRQLRNSRLQRYRRFLKGVLALNDKRSVRGSYRLIRQAGLNDNKID